MSDLVPVNDGGGLVLSGKAARALQMLQEGVLADPDERRDPGAARFHRERLTEATRRAYLRWIKQYLYFCGVTGRREVPASAATLEAFMIWIAELQPKKGRNAGKGAGMAPASMRQALSAIRSFHEAANESWPSTKLALGIIEGHEAIRAKRSDIHDDQGVPPIKLPTLLELIRACPTDTNAGIRDRALLSCGFAMMARRSELSILDDEHLSETDTGLRVWVPRTKTNKTKGRVAMLPRWNDYPDVCPTRTVLAWRALRGRLGIVGGPFYRGVDKWDHVNGTGAFAGGTGGRTLRMDPITVELVIARAAARALAEGANIPNAAELRPHSLRAGGATSAYESGADILAIARQGGWGDRSPVVFRYIREVDLEMRNPMRLLGNQGKAS